MLAKSVLSIDISKDVLDTDAHPDPWRRRLPNTDAGIAEIVAQAKLRKALVVFEATSVYDRPVMAALEAAGLPCHRANPRKAREFARAAGVLAKTDRVDAAMLAQYGARLSLPLNRPIGPAREQLRALTDRRAQLVDTRKREQTRLKQVADPDIRAEIEALIAVTAARIATYDARIKETLKADAETARQADLLATGPGVAAITSAVLIAHMPELGRVSAKTIAALAGLAPLARDSGRWRGKRRIWGGRRPVRRLLFLAARHAANHPEFRDFAERLRQKGKAPKQVRIAVARKLLVALNAMIATKKPFQTDTP